MTKIKEGKNMGLARFVRARRTPLSAGDTSPRRRPRASGRARAAPRACWTGSSAGPPPPAPRYTP